MTFEQEQRHEAFFFETKKAVVSIAEVIAGHDLGGDVIEAAKFLKKTPFTGARADTPMPDDIVITPDQEAEIRAYALKMGIGRRNNVGLAELGLPAGTNVVCEGGLVNKYLAQILALKDGSLRPGLVALVAEPERNLGDADVRRMGQVGEHLGLSSVPDLTGKNELDLARLLPDFKSGIARQIERDLPIGFDIKDGSIEVNENRTGQVRMLGLLGISPVVIISTGKYHRDDSGKNFYRPGVADFNEVASRASGFLLDRPDSPVAAITSDLYGATRRMQNPNTLTYGRDVMAQLVGEEPIALNQIIGEAHRATELFTTAK